MLSIYYSVHTLLLNQTQAVYIVFTVILMACILEQ